MKFGDYKLRDAKGGILAHSLALPTGRLRKGQVLGPDELAALAAAGHQDVTIARLEPGDLGEDAAATHLAEALVPDPSKAGLRLIQASTGRVNVYGTGPGVLGLDAGAIHAANLVDPMITIATLPPLALTRDRGLVATVKIISYGVAKAQIDRAAQLARGAMHVHPVTRRSAALIMTELGSGAGKGEDAMRGRLRGLGITLEDVACVPHHEAALGGAIARTKADLILILTASATSDAQDVAPAALRLVGGEVTRFGMPVDPGNLLFLGRYQDRPVIGLPGCARSPALNGADWVLERVACGLEVTDDDVARMGVGGLLKESPARPHPREGKA